MAYITLLFLICIHIISFHQFKFLSAHISSSSGITSHLKWWIIYIVVSFPHSSTVLTWCCEISQKVWQKNRFIDSKYWKYLTSRTFLCTPTDPFGLAVVSAVCVLIRRKRKRKTVVEKQSREIDFICQISAHDIIFFCTNDAFLIFPWNTDSEIFYAKTSVKLIEHWTPTHVSELLNLLAGIDDKFKLWLQINWSLFNSE